MAAGFNLRIPAPGEPSNPNGVDRGKGRPLQGPSPRIAHLHPGQRRCEKAGFAFCSGGLRPRSSIVDRRYNRDFFTPSLAGAWVDRPFWG